MKFILFLLLFQLSLLSFGQDSWIQKADFGGTPRTIAAGFGIDNRAYIGTGYCSNTSYTNDCKAYVATGQDYNGIYRTGLWEYTNSVTATEQRMLSFDFTVQPNPASGDFSISSTLPLKLFKIYDSQGKEAYVSDELLNSNLIRVQTFLDEGLYFVAAYHKYGEIAGIKKIVITK